MKRKLYTLSHDVSLLKEIDNDGGQFTAEEHAYIIEKEWGATVIQTRENLLRSYLQENFSKLAALGFLIDAIKRNEYKNILSLGAGRCVLEYLLKMSLPEKSQVVACDFDSFLVKKAKEFFPEILVERFDLFKDDINYLQSKLNMKFDLAVFFGSTYVMDDKEFIKLFGDLKKNGVKAIIDFHAGYMDFKHVIKHCLEPITGNPVIRKIFRKSPIHLSERYRGKFHGYSRSRRELIRLYKKSGLKLRKKISVLGYPFVAILS